MSLNRTIHRFAAAAVIGFAMLLQAACMDGDDGALAPPLAPQFGLQGQQGLDRAVEAQERHAAALMRIPGVVGTAVGLTPGGSPVIRVFLVSPSAASVPSALEGIPVRTEVTGLFMAHSDPTQRLRPAPIGYSVGHPAITAGTIGARVTDVSGEVYILSNNHVLAAMNQGSSGDGIVQPGAFDGGRLPGDFVGTLSAFEPLDFSGGDNLMDAALARTTRNDVLNATPADDGYGMPVSDVWGDGNGDGVFDNRNALLGLDVKKYGRTTKLTNGEITGVNARVSVCYDGYLFICFKSATFVDQLIIQPGAFSGGGDSGSLIVSGVGNQPVGLLFAGSTSQTIANRIDHVLNRFGVAIDDGTGSPDPVLDVAVTGVNAPASTTEGNVVDVAVTVRNVGNQDAQAFDVMLDDLTGGTRIGVSGLPGLPAGQSATHTFAWDTDGASVGPHTLRGGHTLVDGNAGNDEVVTTVQVNAPGTLTGIHVADLDGFNASGGSRWSAVVEVMVHDANHDPINGATVTGSWDQGGLASTVCTTGEGGGNGTCIFMHTSVRGKRVAFTVAGVVMNGQIYQASANHDPDGDSNGTTIVVTR